MPPQLDQLIDPGRIVDLQASTKEEALRELVEVMASSTNVTDSTALLEKILEREKLISTGVGIGVALPHVKIPSVRDFVLAIGRSQRGLDFQSLDDKPVHIVVMIGANDSQSGEFLKLMAKIVLRLKDKEFRRRVLLAKNAEEIRELFIADDYRAVSNPEGA
jgi:fructose-specific phosphotransferase system IIA component